LKFIEISTGLLQPVSNEEGILVEKVRGHTTPLPKSILSAREQQLAKNLVMRGVLTRFFFENKLCFAVNTLDDTMEF
jgi:hypothetical protein